MSICPVSRCDGVRHQGWSICKPCADQLRKNLAEAPAIDRELEISGARLRSNAPRDSSGSSESILPYRPDASEARDVLRSTLAGWVRELDGVLIPGTSLVQAMSLWLLGRHNALIVHNLAHEAVEEIAAAVGRPLAGRPTRSGLTNEDGTEQPWTHGRTKLGEQLYDNPPDRVFLGACPTCNAADMYARDGDIEVRCPGCDGVHPVADLRDVLRVTLADKLVTAAEAVSMLVVLGETTDRQRTRNRITKWDERGRILAHPSPNGPRYRFGDITARMAERAAGATAS